MRFDPPFLSGTFARVHRQALTVTMSSMQIPSNALPVADNCRPAASVIVPAHNEAAVLGRLLTSLPAVVGQRRLQVIVACNGCTDNTANIARNHGATVIELEAPSKIAALNAAEEFAEAFPRIYIDADVVVNGKTIEDLIVTLTESGVLCAAPPHRLELTGRSWLVRAYFTVWSEVMRLRNGYVGSGVYALSEKGRARFDRFPNVVADDTFVRNLFREAERQVVTTDPTVVETPRTLRSLFRRRVRVAIGNLQLRSRLDFSLPGLSEPKQPWWLAVVKRPKLIPSGLVYAIVNLAAELVARRQLSVKRSVDWGRDETTRPTEHCQ